MSESRTGEAVEVRLMVPRSALPAPPPDYYSQRNCELLGLGKRQFLELLRRPGAPPVTRIGKTRLVARADMLDFLERIRHAAAEAAAEREDLDGGDKVLLELGCAPRPNRRKTG